MNKLYDQKNIFNTTSIIKNYFWWLGIFCCSLFSSLTLSLIIYLSVNNEWAIAKYYSDTTLAFTWTTFPFYLLLPIFIFILFIFIFFYFSKLKYTLSWLKFSIIIIFTIFLLSLLFFYISIGQKINNVISHYSFYNTIIAERLQIWQHPELGLLSGEITNINNINNFLLLDFNGQVWNIQSQTLQTDDNLVLQNGKKIKILGRPDNKNIFFAQEIKTYD